MFWIFQDFFLLLSLCVCAIVTSADFDTCGRFWRIYFFFKWDVDLYTCSLKDNVIALVLEI